MSLVAQHTRSRKRLIFESKEPDVVQPPPGLVSMRSPIEPPASKERLALYKIR